MADDFFKQDEVEETQDTPEVFKLGDKEYSQDELQKLVGLGEIAREAETKWNTPINKVFPEYTKATQELKAYRDKEAQAALNPEPVAPVPGQLTAEQRAEAIRQLKELGFASQADIDQRVQAQLAAKELLQDVDSILSENREAGNPSTTASELLTHMQDTGIKNPAKAYKDMFETELDEIKEKKLSTIKGSGMVTTTGSTAGAKTPTNIKVTRDNLAEVVAEALGGAN